VSELPTALSTRPFTTREAAAAGVGRGALSGPRFERIHRGVYVISGFALDLPMRIAAAKLALPADAHLSHATRVQQLGLQIGSPDPLHFTIARDLHVIPRGVFLHRTKVLPPLTDGGVSPAAAFLSIANERPLLDVIVVGDWLLQNEHMTTDEVAHLAHRESWRPGAAQALFALPWLNGRAASPQETRSRCYLVFAGLPEPLVNVPLTDDPNSPVLDLYCPEWHFAWEYEGAHHFRDAAQIKRDVWRYAELRANSVDYLQIYDEVLANPRSFVLRSHQLLAARGYCGPRPDFGVRWNSLTRPIPRNLPRPVP
jgi:hypothetical protein